MAFDYFQDRTCRSFLEPSFSLTAAIGTNIVYPPIAGAIAWAAHRFYFQSQHPAQYALLWTCRIFTFIPIQSMGDFILGKDLPLLASNNEKDEETSQPINYTREIGKVVLFALFFFPSVYASHSLAIRLGCTILEPWSLALLDTYLPFYGTTLASQIFGVACKAIEASLVQS